MIYGYKQLVVTAICYLVALSARAQSGDEILQKHLEKSGQSLWDQIGSAEISGQWVDEKYERYPIKLTAKAPDKIRIDGLYGGKSFIEAFNGSFGWVRAPWKKTYDPQAMNRQETLVLTNSLHLGSPLGTLIDRLVFLGLNDLEGEVYHTFAYEKGSLRRTFYLSPANHQLLFERIEFSDHSERISVLKIYEGYRNYSGLLMPTAVRLIGEGWERELVFEDVALGIGARDSLFEFPE